MQFRRHTSGFSLLELMIVIAIIGVLAAIAIPSFNDLIKNNRRTVIVNELMGNFMLARAEAAKQGRPVVVCGNTIGDLLNCAGVNNWNHGWIAAVWVDADSDDSVDSGELQTPMKQYVNDYPDIKITASGAGPFKVKPFNRSSTKATITVCDKRGASKARALIMSGNGRARVSETESDGNALTCPP